MNLRLTRKEEWNGGEEVCPYDTMINPKGDLDPLKINRDYIVTYKDNVDLGTATATIKGKGDYYGTVETSFEIIPFDLAASEADEATVYLKTNKFTYSGKDLQPEPVVDITYPARVTKDDYTVSYPAASKNVGAYTVTIKFNGNYTGTVELDYTVNPKGTKLSKVSALSKGFTAKWRKQATQTTGYELRYSLKSNMAKAKIVPVAGAGKTSKVVKKLKAKKKYYVQIRTYKTVNGTKYYSAWSAARSVKTR